jgi:acetyl-CoA acetyltransferase
MAERVVIVGAAASDSGYLPQRTPLELHVEAAARALADAGLQKDDIDGLFSTGDHRYGMMPPVVLCEYMGIHPRYVDGTNVGGGAWEFMVRHAVGALQSGLCSVALLSYGANSRTTMANSNGPGERFTPAGTPTAYEDPFGLTLPSRAALVASRHMHEFGTTSEHLAAVAVAMRTNAQHNPDAMYRKPITIDDVLSSRMITDPLHLLDCCVVSDGGGALVLTTESRARDVDRQPVFVLGTGEAIATETMAGWSEFGRMAAEQSGREAFAMAGLVPADIDTLQLYDAFTINVILQLEALGFCPLGEGGEFVADGKLAFDGALPTNTDGGALSSNHPGMRGIFLMIEAVRQLRGEAGVVQVPNARTALCNGTGGPFSSSGTVILGVA